MWYISLSPNLLLGKETFQELMLCPPTHPPHEKRKDTFLPKPSTGRNIKKTKTSNTNSLQLAKPLKQYFQTPFTEKCDLLLT